jgi:DNA-binding GntR family transcriptional regulator
MTTGSLNHRAAISDPALVFEALDMALTHVIRRLAAPSTVLQTSQRELIERHLVAQLAADARFAVPGADFLRLLATLHGNAVITQLIDEILTLHCQPPIPSVGARLQRRLFDAILSNQPDDAVAIFRQGCLDFEQDQPQDETDSGSKA